MRGYRRVLELAYRGTAYAGWQRQPNAHSVEETIDTALSTILEAPVKIVGCGRTDAGVHASDYVAHFDYGGKLPPRFLARLNRYLPADIAVRRICAVPEDFHARFAATSRSYSYRISDRKDPFRIDTIAWLPAYKALDRQAMQAAAALLPRYTTFGTFCKTNSDAYTMRCTVTASAWSFTPDGMEYRITANRFLRGMVRLIVGMCLRVGSGKLRLEEVERAMERQIRLPNPLSAPAEGLFLTSVEYPGRTDWVEVP